MYIYIEAQVSSSSGLLCQVVRRALYYTQIACFFPETLITLFNAFGASEKYNVHVSQCLDYIISVFICFYLRLQVYIVIV